MSEENSRFNAPGSAMGYFYQARLALLECLRYIYRESGVEVAIERLDDVSFEKDGEALELLQTKHHVTRHGDLTDSSPDVWKTLRIWSQTAKSAPGLPERTRLAIITTSEAPQGSAASFLRPSGQPPTERDPDKAEALLLAAVAKSTNQALRPAFEAFQSLTPEMRRVLLSAIEVLDRAPVLVELEAVIEDRIIALAPRGKHAAARELLEGWWWPRIFKALQSNGTIPITELEAKIDDIRELMKRDSLPVDMDQAEPAPEELQALEEMVFVRQLRSVGTGNNRIQFAKRDYYRAFTQRSKWARLNLLFDGEISRFEKTLIEEWEPRFHGMCDDLNGNDDAQVVRQAGQDLYSWAETQARFPFRTVNSRFISVGSYHILADAVRLGWHRDYQKLMKPEGGGDDDS